MTVGPERLGEIAAFVNRHTDPSPEQWDWISLVNELHEGCAALHDLALRERARADDAESWCARLANDREVEAALAEVGVAKALAAVEELLLAEQERGGARANLILAIGAIKGRCGPALLPPHEETLAENRRLRAALAEIVRLVPLDEPGSSYRDLGRIASAALAPDPLN